MNEENTLIQIIAFLSVIIVGLTTHLIIGNKQDKGFDELTTKINESRLILEYKKGYQAGKSDCFIKYVVEPTEESIN